MWRGIIRSKQGQSLVEMAIILPLLLLLVMGTIEFGRVFGSYLVMENLAAAPPLWGGGTY